MEMTKEKIIGATVSGVFCLLLLLLLWFTVISTQIKTGEEGILVNFGTVSLSSGTFTPKTTGQPAEKPQPERVVQQPQPQKIQQKTPTVQPKQTQPVITGNEQTVAIDNAKLKNQEKERIESERAKAEQAKAEEERRKREAINQQIAGAFGAGSSNQSQAGTSTAGTGIQGNPDSSSPTGNPAGSGGYGEFNLAGRSLVGGLPRPSYSAQEEGRIVINITVDIVGNVIFTEIGKGTNIENAKMRQDALKAAKNAKFNSIKSGNNQTGTITYKYSLR
jgi:TonB family protein